jgi:heme exporter protein D
MDPLASFLEMGGYARFVWPSFAVTLVVLGGLLIESVRALKARQQRLAALQAASQRRRKEAAGEAPQGSRG